MSDRRVLKPSPEKGHVLSVHSVDKNPNWFQQMCVRTSQKHLPLSQFIYETHLRMTRSTL